MKNTDYGLIAKFVFLGFMVVLWSGSQTFAQQIEGEVVDAETGETLIGVNVVVKNTTTGTSTDMDGRFELEVPSLDEVLVVSYIGYETMEIPIEGRTEIFIEMSQMAFAGDEIVVVGYGEIRRSDLTGSISSVSSAEITQVPTTNAIEAIQGKVPGMDITRGSGQPGSGFSIQIRGNRSLTAGNNPLFIVDGIPFGSIDDINPSDIESIEVLKDASSTAIYGSRGANGVVLISTKQAARGATRVEVNSQVGFHNVYAYPDVMTGPEYVERARQARRTQNLWEGPVDRISEFAVLPGDENIFTPQDLNAIENGIWTDYRDMLIDQNVQNDHRISVSTGTGNTRVYLSLNFYDEGGILEKDHLSRYAGRLNIDQRISDALLIGLNAQVSFTDHDRRREPFNLGNKINPLHEAFLEDGSLNLQPTDRDISPLADLEPGVYDNNQQTTRLFPTLFTEFTPNEQFRFRTNISGTFTNRRHGIYRASETIDRALGVSEAEYNTDYDRSFIIENIATWQVESGDHSASLTGIQSYQYSRGEESRMRGQDQLLDSQSYYGMLNTISGVAIDSRYEESSLASFAGRINYGWQHKYLLTLTGRYDGSSRLAEGNKWAFFPSIAASWRIIEEDFMQDSPAFSDLKIRASFGVSGNESVNPYSTQSSLTRIPMGFDNAAAPGFGFSNQLGNSDLEWELSKTVNLGFDIGLWNNRLYASIDLYNTETSNLLLRRALPSTSGVTSVIQNVGETRNRGIEVALSSENISTTRFGWTTDVTFFSNKEEIVSLITDEDIVANGWFIGEPTQVFYDYEKIGIWQEDEAEEAAAFGQAPGEIKVKDQNGDGEITANEDRVILGSARPKWSGSLENRFNFGNFDLSFSLFARVGQMMDFGLYDSFKDGPEENGASVNYWTPENPGGSFPRPGNGTPYRSTINYLSGSYLKLRNASVGYSLPGEVAERFALRSARVYVSGRNLHIWTKADDYDPERGGSANFPMTRLFAMGINLQF